LVVVGAGFAGLEAVRVLARTPIDIILIDRNNHHCFQPLLYQVATAVLSPADIAWPIRSLLRSQSNVTVVMAEVTAVDKKARRVQASGQWIAYDRLVLATGATHSYFGHDEWGPIAPGLKRIEDATVIRRRLLTAFEKAELAVDPVEIGRLLTFVIIGAGPTGVELAGSVAEIAKHSLTADFRNINPGSARVLLVEAGPRVLAALPEDLAAYAARVLTEMGVEILCTTRVTGCDARGADTDQGRIGAATLIWAAGVVASPAATWLGVEQDRAGRVRVEPDLTVPGHPEISVIGDTASVVDSFGRAVPGVAPAAKQMGHYVGRRLAGELAGKSVPEIFRYRHHGDLATIGRKAAVVKLKHLQLRGLTGWMFWGLAHIYYLITIKSRLAVSLSWLWNYVTYQRGARLITVPDAASLLVEENELASTDTLPSSGKAASV